MKKLIPSLLAALLLPEVSAAQVVQPVYVRQSNPSTPVFDNKFVGSGASTSTKVWSMETYAAVQLTFTAVSSCNVPYQTWVVASPGPFIRVVTQLASATQYFWVESAPTGSGPWSTTTSILDSGIYTIESVGLLCTFDLDMKFLAITPKSSAIGPYATGKTLVDPPFPVIVGALRGDVTPPVVSNLETTSTGALLVSDDNVSSGKTQITPANVTTTTTVHTFDGATRATIQNNGTGVLLCNLNNPGLLTVNSTNYDWSLAAATAVDNGTGGSITLPYVPLNGQVIRCAALSGTARVSGFVHR